MSENQARNVAASVRARLTNLAKSRGEELQLVRGRDAVLLAPTRVEYPSLHGFPAPILRAYPREAVVAKKFQAMVALGIGNSRMNDFFDLWVLCRDFPFEGADLAGALDATFERRKTAVPSTSPLALTKGFRADPMKVVQWEAFIRKGRLDAKGMSLEAVCEVLSDFLMPVSRAVAAREPFQKSWKAGGPWR